MLGKWEAYLRELYCKIGDEVRKLGLPSAFLAGGTFSDLHTTRLGVESHGTEWEENSRFRYLMETVGVEHSLLLNALMTFPLAYLGGKFCEAVMRRFEGRGVNLSFVSTENFIYAIGLVRYFAALWNARVLDPLLELAGHDVGVGDVVTFSYFLTVVPFVFSYVKNKFRSW